VAKMTFRELMVQLEPPWLQSAAGKAWARANGDMKDSLVARVKEAVKARFAQFSPEDALNLLGVERQLPRGISIDTATYRDQLIGAWDSWPWAGTAYGVLNALRDAGYPGTQLQIAKGWRYSLDATTQALVKTFLNPGLVDPYWSSFFVYFPSASFPARWSGTPPASNSDEAQFIIALVKRWKSGHARFDSVVFNMGGPIWGVSTWGSFNWGGTAPVVWSGPF
jgi:hypothetical protein